MNWLDIETKSILQGNRESNPAPVKAGDFALIMLKEGQDFQRLVRALQTVNRSGEVEATRLACMRLPYVVNHGLTETEAMQGQFELICCDSISVFLRSEILSAQTGPDYLQTLFQEVLRSPEFHPVHLKILHLPQTESSQEFSEQFLGSARKPVLPASIIAPFKKARIMAHWAGRIGAEVQFLKSGPTTDREPGSI